MKNIISEELDSELFKFKDCNPVLFPLIFNMQALTGEPTNDYQVYEQVRLFHDDDNVLEQINLFDKKKYSHQELKTVYKAQLDRILKKDYDNIFSNSYCQLCDYLENPFHYFLMKHDHEGDITESELLEEFPGLLEEIGRDNVVTENEKELLLERATELGLPAYQINNLQNNRFIGYKTFRVLVDQVCEDGIITDREHAFILEKADQYNVPENVVSKLLKRGLAKNKILREKSVDENFYTYVVSFFVLRFVEKSIDESIISENLTYEIFNVDSIAASSIKDIRGKVLTAIEKSLSVYLNTDIEVNDVRVFLRNLGLNILTKEEALSRYESVAEERTVEDFEKKYTSSTKEFKGFLYQIEYTSLNSNELFKHKVKGDEVTVQLNTGHPLLEKSDGHSEAIEFFLITLISTKFEYTNNKHVNHFWNLFKLYQQHFTLTNH